MDLFLRSLLIVWLLVSAVYCTTLNINISTVLSDSWSHYKIQKIEPVTDRPLADLDRDDVANGSKNKYLTFSETVSYVLYRSALINDKQTFDKTWVWARDNMQRKNVGEVFSWFEQKWVPIRDSQRDSLFAWRYTPNINNTGRGGIIHYYWKPEVDGKLWRDGLDVAPDGDQLIAGALILADQRWGSGVKGFNYRQEAYDIISDLWRKTVRKFDPGVIVCSEQNALDWFMYQSSGGVIVMEPAPEKLHIQVSNASYAGMGRMLSNCDLRFCGDLRLSVRGNGMCRMILEDNKKQKWFSHRLMVANRDNYEEYVLNFPEAPKDFDRSKVNVIMLEFTNGSYDLKTIYLGTLLPKSENRYHLFSNDKNMPWINVSYYMPVLYRWFAKLDRQHPWEQLAADAYKDMRDSLFSKLSNSYDEVFSGSGKLFPNWMTYNEIGQIVDLPWAKDGFIDDYMSGWDAFRSWYFMAVDKMWGKAAEPDYYLNGESYKFFKDQLERYGYIRVGYTISGGIRNINWVDQNSFGSNGAYLSFFKAAKDNMSAQKILDHILKVYDPAGYWEEPLEYYKQNWVWFGLAFYSNLGEDLFKSIQEKAVL